ncbi:MAG: allophanate hydrolase subunit 2 family protein, partial [Proteobacteria bacterium]|nr:allophanate hydrolase subunit 2 family protein [Pseudomonadota bacterium]
MSAQLEVLEPGLAVAVQDRGRFGFRRLGVPVAG